MRDIESLREVGLDDRAIHDACAIVSYFAFVNRIADGLGVELEGHTSGGQGDSSTLGGA
jgi:alkylhydroperoxidase family enzyme